MLVRRLYGRGWGEKRMGLWKEISQVKARIVASAGPAHLDAKLRWGRRAKFFGRGWVAALCGMSDPGLDVPKRLSYA